MSETIDNIVGIHVTNLEISGLTYSPRFEIYSMGASKPPTHLGVANPISSMGSGFQLQDLPLASIVPEPTPPAGMENLRIYNLGEGAQIHLHEGAGTGSLKIGEESILTFLK